MKWKKNPQMSMNQLPKLWFVMLSEEKRKHTDNSYRCFSIPKPQDTLFSLAGLLHGAEMELCSEQDDTNLLPSTQTQDRDSVSLCLLPTILPTPALETEHCKHPSTELHPTPYFTCHS